ncbi:MAG: hypothetical protein FD138_3680 [Planctomycetota bacterium]|nr:MAG: hypothetical protein FD138_3680 [Planctomycetota bacterium]
MCDHLATAEVRLQPIQNPCLRLFDRRRRQRDVLGINSGVVASDQIPPTIRTALNRVRMMLATALHLQQHIGRPVRFVVTVSVPKPQQPFPADGQKIRAVPVHPLNADRRTFREEFRFVRDSVRIGVDQQLDVSVPGNRDSPARVNRHAMNVVSQLVVREQPHIKTGRSFERRFRRVQHSVADARTEQHRASESQHPKSASAAAAAMSKQVRHPSPRD